MEKDKGKKYQYTYYTATGKEIIEVDENWCEILRQGDRDIYNNNRREEYKSYHWNGKDLKTDGVKEKSKKNLISVKWSERTIPNLAKVLSWIIS